MRGARDNTMWKRFWIILALLCLGMLLINRHIPEPLTLRENKPEITHAFALLLLLSFLGARVFSYVQKSDIRRIIKYGVTWLGIFLIVAVAYSFRFELVHVKNKVLANLIPGRSIEKKPGRMSFQISPNGHFYIRVMINNVPIRFLADTGASDIVLTPKAGTRLGFDLKQLSFDRIYQTANGIGRGASINLADMRIGDLRLRNVRASINEAAMSHSLLGMSFFNRLKGYEVKGGVLTVYY